MVASPAPGSKLLPASKIRLTFSSTVTDALGSSRPTLSPASPGSWRQTSTATPSSSRRPASGSPLGSRVRVVPAPVGGGDRAGGHQPPEHQPDLVRRAGRARPLASSSCSPSRATSRCRGTRPADRSRTPPRAQAAAAVEPAAGHVPLALSEHTGGAPGGSGSPTQDERDHPGRRDDIRARARHRRRRGRGRRCVARCC